MVKQVSYMVGLTVAVGIAAAGWFIGNGIIESRADDRYVTVKGLSERQVDADLAFWTLNFVASGNELGAARSKLRGDQEHVLAFLKDKGIDEADLDMQGFRIMDKLALVHAQEKVAQRYLLQQSISVRTDNVTAVATASQKLGELLDKGVLLGTIDGYSYNQGPQYQFSGLNKIKPDMVGEATANARMAAQKFALDAGTEIKGIRRAQQGQFQIFEANSAGHMAAQSQLKKTVRVVTTLQYILRK